MASLRISELASQSGVPVSTLRYYERIGLVEPSCRASNGYREYDQSILERLAFIGRAKRLGMTLDDIATLIDAWFAGECEPLRNQLRAVVAARISQLRRQIVDDTAFERQLDRILLRLSDAGPSPQWCAPDCGCDTDPLVTTRERDRRSAGRGSPPLGCSLSPAAADGRTEDWRQVLARGTRTEPTVDRHRIVFDPSPELVARLAKLCSAEVACCPFFTFTLEIASGTVALTVEVPPDAHDRVGTLFG